MRPKLSGIYISRLPERADSEFTRLQINAADGVGGLNAPPYWRMQGRGVSWIHADDNAPPCLRSACLIMAAGRYRRDGPGPWYAMACGTACVAFIGRDGPLWPAACPGLPQTPADWVSGYGLGRLRRAGTCDCGGISVRGPAWSRGNCDLCSGHQCTGLDTVRVLTPHPTLPCTERAALFRTLDSEGA